MGEEGSVALSLHGFGGAWGSPSVTLLAPGTQQIHWEKGQQGKAFMQGDISRSDPNHSLHWESSCCTWISNLEKTRATNQSLGSQWTPTKGSLVLCSHRAALTEAEPGAHWFCRSFKPCCAEQDQTEKPLKLAGKGAGNELRNVGTHSSWAGRALFAWVRSLWLENLPPRGSQTSAPAPWSQEGEWGTCQWPSPPGTAPCSRYLTAPSSECPAASRAEKHTGGEDRQGYNTKLQKNYNLQ